MARNSDLPCDGDGVCMVCKKTPSENETLTCKTCVTPWHVNCLSTPPETLAATVQWECPDCSFVVDPNPVPNPTVEVADGSSSSGDLIAAVRLIENDKSLTDQEKAKRRQELMCGGGKAAAPEETKRAGGSNDVLNLFDESMNCSFCMQLPERPVTTPCGHNFCLKCFQKWVGQGKRTCANCRSSIPAKMASQPRINAALVVAIRMAKISKCSTMGAPSKTYHFVHNQNRPDKAYTTERAKKTGKANACSGKIFVTVPPDHFGPILAENDPLRNQGVLVGETWEDRMECRQWGTHLPHVAGIAGQSDYGSQSVALSGGYEDDEDHGEWFLYTGSGGRDLSGNKRTNKTQSFDQKFDKMNEALRVSCKMGYPVRVVRSHKEKRSCYAPESGVRYDGVYRIEKCWRKEGIQGFKVCRYLFVRCDNAPAPWTSDEQGDRPRPLPTIGELKKATDITERKGTASWDYDEGQGCWTWKKPPPESRKRVADNRIDDDGKITIVRRKKPAISIREKLLKEFSCLICHKVMNLPLTTPCAHNFCKPCLEGSFAGKAFIKERTCEGRRTLRAQKNIFKCPSCSNDITDFLQNPQVNRELMGVIESLQQQGQEVEEDDPSEENNVSDEIKTNADDTLDSEEGKEGSTISQSEIQEAQQTDDLEKTKAVLQEKPLAESNLLETSPVKEEVVSKEEPKETAVDNKKGNNGAVDGMGKKRGRKARGSKVSPSEIQEPQDTDDQEKAKADDQVLQEKPLAETNLQSHDVETSPKRTPKRKQVENVVIDSVGKTRGQKARGKEGSALSPSKIQNPLAENVGTSPVKHEVISKEAAADNKVKRTSKRKQAENVVVVEGMSKTRGQKAKRMI